MKICQHCHAIVDDHNLRCSDCGVALTSVEEVDFPPPPPGSVPLTVPEPDASPLAELDRELDPDEFLRQLLGQDDAEPPKSAPTPPPPPSAPAGSTPANVAPPPSSSATLPPPPGPTPAPPGPMPAAAEGVRPNVAPLSTPPHTPRPEHRSPQPQGQAHIPGAPHPAAAGHTTGGSRAPQFAKSGDAPVQVGEVYSVTARSNRLSTAATLGRSDKHRVLVTGAIVGAGALFAIGALVGWANWQSPEPASATATSEPASVDEGSANLVADDVRGSFVRVEGASCDDTPIFGFVTSDVVVVPAVANLADSEVRVQYFSGEVDTGEPLGVTPDGRFLIIRPGAAPRSSLERGLAGPVPAGSAVSMIDLDALSQSDDDSFQLLIAVSSEQRSDDTYWTYFDQQSLTPFMPIIDEDNRLRGTVSEDGTHAVALGSLGLDISSLKLHPTARPSSCEPDAPADDTDTAADAPATDAPATDADAPATEGDEG